MKIANLNYCLIFKLVPFSLLCIVKVNAQNKTVQNDTPRCDLKKSFSMRMEHIPADVILKQVSPKYPQKARKQKIEGTVSVKVLINEKGIVEKACAFNGNKVFWTEAEKAALKWRFKPKYGLAFSVQIQDKTLKRYAYTYISFTFKLPK